MNNLLAKYALEKTPILLRFRDDPAPAGPGLLTHVGDELYTFQMPVQQGSQRGILPVTFRAQDVLWVSTGAVKEEEPRIVPAGGPLSFGGRPS